jgi:DNA-binding NtrC family response regulator
VCQQPTFEEINMSNATTLVSDDFLSRGRQLSRSQKDMPFSVRLESLREIAYSLLTELDSLGRLAPKPAGNIDLNEEVKRFESELIKAALEKARGNQSQAARMLGVKNTTLNAKLKRYKIRYSERPLEAALALGKSELAA